MKQIIRESWSKTINEEREQMELAWNRQQEVESTLLPALPKDVNATFYFSAEIPSIIRCWVTIQPTYDVDNKKVEPDPLETASLKMFANAFTGHEGRKAIRKNSGSVYWVYEQKRNGYEFWLIIENCHPGTCKIEKVTKEIEVFEITC